MISVIIPTFNEEGYISSTIVHLNKLDVKGNIGQIIVADGGSTDATISNAKRQGAKIIACPEKGRAAQMNFAAKNTSGDILYFIHADTIPPIGFTENILEAVERGFEAGSFRLKFDYNHWFLNLNAWFTRFNIDAVRFGDQSLFVTKRMFEKTGGFSELLIVMEDQHLVKKLQKCGPFKIIGKDVITSSRKYIENGIYKTQAVFFAIFFMYKLGFTQATLLKTYKKLLKQDKV